MKLAAICTILLASCSAKEVGNSLLPDEFMLGRGSSSIHTTGNHNHEYDGEGESEYAAFTWYLPSMGNDLLSREDRRRIRSESLLIDELVATEEEEPREPMASGGTLRADWRHAAAFGGIMLLLLIILLVKLRRSNGWH